MKNLQPKNIFKEKAGFLTCEWHDGFKSTIRIENLRDECPCADCHNERQKQFNTKIPVLKTFKEGKYNLLSLKPVGNYAVVAIWGDGHEIGLYDWALLRNIFEKYQITADELNEIEAKKN